MHVNKYILLLTVWQYNILTVSQPNFPNCSNYNLCLWHWFTDLLHLMEGVDDFPGAPWLWGNRGSRGIDMGHQISNSIKGERSLNKLPQSDMVVSLVEKQRRGTNQTLFAFRVGGLEQVWLSHQHKLCSLRASQHHTWTPKNMGLENFSIPTKNIGKLLDS